MTEKVQSLYRESGEKVRASFAGDRERAVTYYSDLVRFVRDVYPAEANEQVRLLDVGCGSGWSTFAFAESGYNAVGIDLNARAFEVSPSDRCALRQGSATEIPFPCDSFDVVACYQCLEHVPEPAHALEEMVRVCRPGGVLFIVGPNLLSPTLGIIYAMRPSSWNSLRIYRRSGMPRHPYGNTLPEIIAVALVRSAQLLAQLISKRPRFPMREPDQVPPFHADNDACYLCNPVDLIAYFSSIGCAIQRYGRPGRPALSYLFAGGTWIAARKPAQ